MNKTEMTKGRHAGMSARRVSERASKDEFLSERGRAARIKHKLQKAGQSIQPSNVVQITKDKSHEQEMEPNTNGRPGPNKNSTHSGNREKAEGRKRSFTRI
jgi:hypothetical protein